MLDKTWKMVAVSLVVQATAGGLVYVITGALLLSGIVASVMAYVCLTAFGGDSEVELTATTIRAIFGPTVIFYVFGAFFSFVAEASFMTVVYMVLAVYMARAGEKEVKASRRHFNVIRHQEILNSNQ